MPKFMLEVKNFKLSFHSYEVCRFLQLSNFIIYIMPLNYTF